MHVTRSATGALSIERSEGGTARMALAPTTAPAPGLMGKTPSVSAVAVPRAHCARPMGMAVQAAVFPGAWQASTLADAGVPVRL